MKNSAKKAKLIAVFLLFSAFAKANDTLIKFGQNLAAAPNWSYIGGGTNLDNDPGWKNNIGYAETGWLTSQKSAFGFGATTPVKNTAIPENTSAGGGGNSGARYPTLYFRKVVNITNPSAFINFQIRLQCDDAVVIWVNGTQVHSQNITTPAFYNTWANGANSGNGSVIHTATVSASEFNPGNNLIAVELHQVNATSSDLFFDMELIGADVSTLTRGPYLQMGTQTGVTVRWRTDVATNSRVTFGTTLGSYTNTVDDATFTTEHIVNLTGLTADTKYFYTIGSTAGIIQSGAANYFTTLPLPNTTRKLRFLGFGDCGNASTNQIDTKNAALSYIGANEIDGVFTIGDNAYNSGLDTEFQLEFFDIYKDDILKNKKLYPTPGNHDYGNSSANTGVRNNAYYNSFTLPTAGEIGGVASGTEAYYSYDIGNVHFISLDSYGREDANTTKMYDTSGTQCVWLKNDLAANTKRWTVVYFHHPPYTKTSHNSDTETADLMLIRERFIRILERYGVDLVICGHSHGYERSYLLKNYYNNPSAPLLDANFDAALHTATGNTQNGRYDGITANSCAYSYNDGKYNHGSIYIVSGSSGQLGGTTAGYPHDAMYYSNVTNGGSFYFEVDSNRLDAKFISYSLPGVTPVIRDQFTIFKNVGKKQTISLSQGTPSVLTASWRGTYNWPNNGGATTRSITENNNTVGSFTYYVNDGLAPFCIQDTFIINVSPLLPVTLTGFNAALHNNKVQLTWATSQEINNKHFTIEKSDNGINFIPLAQVPGAGTTGTAANYSYTDKAPYGGNNFYRLSQTDYNGAVKQHGVRKVVYGTAKDFSLAVYTAGANTINVFINSLKPDVAGISILDVKGSAVVSTSITVQNRTTVKQFTLQRGIYIVKVINSSGIAVSSKVMVE